ncbi:MAG TPA: acetylornithine/succinylornithine family transaminase [Polyangiaceae bacterium]|nr:acetylornithine/succinylornithine family transaminase [Polyangiaceae bacterium]
MTNLEAGSEAALVELGRRFLYPNYRQPDLVLVRGQGAVVWDASDRRYLDFYAGIAVSALGHGHPALVRAVSEQAARLVHVSNYFFNEPNVRLAARLCALTGLDRAFFANSGAEAVEAALKLVRRHFFAGGERERLRVIAFHNSFHGRTLGALAATGQDKYREGFGPLPNVTHVPYGDLEAVRAALGPDVAAILVEPVQGEGGVLPPPPGFLPGLSAIANEHGCFLIADEIQTGVGRTGTFLAVEHEKVRPDVVVLAKGLGGGVPIGAMLCTRRLEGALPPGSHGSTFGGNPLASAAALAVLDTLESEDLLATVRARAATLAAGLERLTKQFPSIVRGHRGVGLLQALVLAPELDARALVAELQKAGVLVTVAGGCALRFSPPLVVTDAELEEGLSIVERVLATRS